jgi:hypothetical protein
MPGTDLDAVREAAEAVGGKIEIKRYPMVEIVLPRGKAAEFSKALEGSGAKVLDAEEYRSRLESENVGAPAGTPASGVKKLKQLWDHNGGSAYMNPESVAAGRSAAFKAAQNSRLRGSLIHAEAAGEIAPASWQGLQGQESNCMPHALANSSHGEFSLKETVDAGVQAGIDYSKEGTSEENLDKMLVSLKAVSAQRGQSVSYRTIPIEDYFRQQAAAAESGEPRQAGVLVIRTGRTATDVHGLHAVALRGQIVVDGQHYIVITDSHLNTPLLYTPEAFAEAAVSDGILVIDVEQAKP